jgi:hypothetical protein
MKSLRRVAAVLCAWAVVASPFPAGAKEALAPCVVEAIEIASP